MSHSYEGNTFLIIRTALRREMLLALMRLWDNNPKSLQLKAAYRDLCEDDLVEAFIVDAASRIGIPGAEDISGARLEKRQQAVAL